MKPRSQPANAFTLVELLVVIVVIGIMGSMLTVAVQGVMASSRASRTRTIISLIDSVIQEKYDSYKYRALPVEIPSISFAAGVTGSTLSFEVLSSEAARVRLNMIRDLQRMEMPDRYSDFQGVPVTTEGAPASIYGAANPVMIDGSGNIVGTRADRSARRSFMMSWYGGSSLPSVAQAYRARVTSTATDEYQSAECLYLIMATTYIGGTPAIDSIPTSNIGDTDGDGMLEILDGWGNPIGFIRWPVGFSDPDGVIDLATPDEFDLFRTDFFYKAPAAPPPPSASAVVQAIDVNSGATGAPWALRPLIISAGEDRSFGIAFDPVNSSGNVLPAYSYTNSAWAWPKDVPNMGDESPGRGTGSYFWVDPYMRRFIAANDPGVIDRSGGAYGTARRLPGEQEAGADSDVLADNITNYSLQVAQ